MVRDVLTSAKNPSSFQRVKKVLVFCWCRSQSGRGIKHRLERKWKGRRSEGSSLTNRGAENRTYPFSISKPWHQSVTSGWGVPEVPQFLVSMSKIRMLLQV
jgi:hypothetical protein